MSKKQDGGTANACREGVNYSKWYQVMKSFNYKSRKDEGFTGEVPYSNGMWACNKNYIINTIKKGVRINEKDYAITVKFKTFNEEGVLKEGAGHNITNEGLFQLGLLKNTRILTSEQLDDAVKKNTGFFDTNKYFGFKVYYPKECTANICQRIYNGNKSGGQRSIRKRKHTRKFRTLKSK